MPLSLRPLLLIAISISLFASVNSIAAPVDLWRADSIVSPAWNFEMLIGDSLAPVAVFRNVSSSPQSFSCTFRIRNIGMGLEVYWKRDSTVDLAADSSIRIAFPKWKTIPQFVEQVGTMLCEAFAGPLQRDSAANPDTDHSRDTIRQLLFVFSRLDNLSDFNNIFSTSVLPYGLIPNALKWVNHGAHVVSGDSAALFPPPPNGLQGYPPGAVITSPVIKLNRRDVNERDYANCTYACGDTIISFPINVANITHAILAFSYERGGKGTDSGGIASSLTGPERTVTSPDGRVLRDGDRLAVDFASPSQVTNVTAWKQMWISDGGHDAQFNRVSIPVDSPYTTQNFRFRFRLLAKDDGIAGVNIDDDDPWYVDNVVVVSPIHPEVECSIARVAPSFALTHLPARHAAEIPLDVNIFNNGGQVGSAFGVLAEVQSAGSQAEVFKHQLIVPVLRPASSASLHTTWAGGQLRSGNYCVTAFMNPKGYDAESQNDSAASFVSLNFDSVMAYDDGVNDVADQTSTPGLGLNLPPFSPVGGDGKRSTSTGSIAMKFHLSVPDTIHGAMLWLGGFDPGATPLEIRLYRDAGDHPGASLADPCAFLSTYRTPPWDVYRLYGFNCPIVLDTGDYWLGVTQTTVGPLELGGCASRSGCQWEVYDSSSSQAHIITPIHPELADKFAWENGANSGRWNSFYPAHGLPAFGNRQRLMATDTIDCGTAFVTRTKFANEGSWIPMLRPYFGPADTVRPKLVSKVKLLWFGVKYQYLQDNDLGWTTTEEQYVEGYRLERKQGAGQWAALPGFVQAYGGTDTSFDYGYWDNNAPTYCQYRLSAIGSFGDTLVLDSIDVSHDGIPANIPQSPKLILQSYPNPFSTNTTITFNATADEQYAITVSDVLGRTVRTIARGMSSANHTMNVSWDGRDDVGRDVPAGMYFCVLKTGGGRMETMMHRLE